jgi:hypothetical protein
LRARVLAVLGFAAVVILAVWVLPAPASGKTVTGSHSACIAKHPLNIPGVFGPYYTGGCTGHDEPELDPVSSLPGSARDLTWTAILPAAGAFPVPDVGPTFWWGGTVTDPNSLFGQAFVELQFYPDAIVTACTPDGGFQLEYAPGDYSVCSPVWKVIPAGTSEQAAFNAMLTNSQNPGAPLVMHASDEITIHWFTTPAADGWHVTVHDLTTGGSGTIVLNSKTDGPLMPAFNEQKIGNALGWGVVNDTPNSFVWEIGHTSDFSTPSGEFCLPGETECDSYDAAHWAGTSPVRILSVTFAGGSKASEWAVVSDFGGKAEVNQYCGAANYGKPFCIYPWYTLGKSGTADSGFHYGVDFPNTALDFGKANQFRKQPLCGGPFGPDSTYCDTVIVR